MHFVLKLSQVQGLTAGVNKSIGYLSLHSNLINASFYLINGFCLQVVANPAAAGNIASCSFHTSVTQKNLHKMRLLLPRAYCHKTTAQYFQQKYMVHILPHIHLCQRSRLINIDATNKLLLCLSSPLNLLAIQFMLSLSGVFCSLFTSPLIKNSAIYCVTSY